MLTPEIINDLKAAIARLDSVGFRGLAERIRIWLESETTKEEPKHDSDPDV